MLVAHLWSDCVEPQHIKPLWRGGKNILKKEQNAEETMTKMTDDKEGWLFLTGCG